MELLEYVWNRLESGEEEGIRTATDAILENLYHQGFIDARRFTVAQWKNACFKFAKGKGAYRFKRSDLESLQNYLFPAQVKRPFDPNRLQDGTRPLDWTNELYQKVLRFETNLPQESWKKIVQNQILPKCRKGDGILYNAYLKGLLEAVLKQHASPLRRLELWYHFEREKEATAKPGESPKAAKPDPVKAAPVVIRDAFVAKPDETIKRSAIDKLYFHHGETPKAADQENLNFLDELAHLVEPEEEEPS